MIEFLASRWGTFPWMLELCPMVKLQRWFKVALENETDEKSLDMANMMGSILGRL